MRRRTRHQGKHILVLLVLTTLFSWADKSQMPIKPDMKFDKKFSQSLKTCLCANVSVSFRQRYHGSGTTISKANFQSLWNLFLSGT